MNFDNPLPQVDLRHDEVFKAVFTANSSQSRAALTGLLSAFIGRKLDIVSVTANELPIFDTRQRQIRYDIGAMFNDGELADIEMMLYPTGSDSLRMQYYLARLFVSQNLKGTEKHFPDLKSVWQLSIAGNKHFFNDKEWFHHFTLFDTERKISLGGQMNILTLELDKLGKTLVKPVAEMSSLERWAVFIRYYTDETKRKLLQDIWEHEEAIKMAAQVVQGFTQDQIAFFQEMFREKRELIEREFQYEIMEDARAEGLAKGLAEGQLKVIALLESGKTLEEAKRILGLNTN